ncbi:hypothetical protein MMC18_003579 [Xylographa bjoerkii]|nr:hypothetical protein [Xylographa bjoerkii]
MAHESQRESGNGTLINELSKLLGNSAGALGSETKARLKGAKEYFVDEDADTLRVMAAIVPGSEPGYVTNLCHIRQISPDIYIDDVVSKSPRVFTRDTIIDHVHINEVVTDPETGWLLFDADGRPMMISRFEQEAGSVHNLCTGRVVKRDAEINILVSSSNDQSSWTRFNAETIAAATRIETEVWASTQQYSSETQIVEIIVAVEDASGGAHTPSLTAPSTSSTERTDEENLTDTSLVPAIYTISCESVELLPNPSSQSLFAIATPMVAPLIPLFPSRPSELSVLAALTSQVIPTSKEQISTILALPISQPQPTTLITSDLKTGFSPDRESTTHAAATPAIFGPFYVSSVKMVTVFTAAGSASSIAILAWESTSSKEVSRKGFSTPTSTVSIASVDRTSSPDVLNASAAAFASQSSPDSLKTSKSSSFTSLCSRIASVTMVLLSADMNSVISETSTIKDTSSSVYSDPNRHSSSMSVGNSSTTLVTMVRPISSISSVMSIAATTTSIPKSMAIVPLAIPGTALSQDPPESITSQYSSLNSETPLPLKTAGTSLSISKPSISMSSETVEIMGSNVTATAMVESTVLVLPADTSWASLDTFFINRIPVSPSSAHTRNFSLTSASNSDGETTRLKTPNTLASVTSTSSGTNSVEIQASIKSTQIVISTGSRLSAVSKPFANVTTSTTYLPQITAHQLGILNEPASEGSALEVLQLSAPPASENITFAGLALEGNAIPSPPSAKEHPLPTSPALEATGSIERPDWSNTSSPPLSSVGLPLPVSPPEPQSLQSSPAIGFPLPEGDPVPESPPPELPPLPESTLPEFPSDNSAVLFSPEADKTNQPDSEDGDTIPQPSLPNLPEALDPIHPDPPIPPASNSPPIESSPPRNSPTTEPPTPDQPTSPLLPPAPTPSLKGNTTFNPLTGEPIRHPNCTDSSTSTPCPSPDPRTSLKSAVPNAPYKDSSAGKFDLPPLKPVPKPDGSAFETGGGKGDWQPWKAFNSSHFDPWTGEHVHSKRVAEGAVG